MWHLRPQDVKVFLEQIGQKETRRSDKLLIAIITIIIANQFILSVSYMVWNSIPDTSEYVYPTKPSIHHTHPKRTHKRVGKKNLSQSTNLSTQKNQTQQNLAPKKKT